MLGILGLTTPPISFIAIQKGIVYQEISSGIKPITQIITNTFSIFWLGKNNFIAKASLN